LSARKALLYHCTQFGFERVLESLVRLLLETGEPRRMSNKQERNNRFITPVFGALAFLLSSASCPKPCPSAEAVISKIENEIRGSKDTHKLRAAASLLVALLPFKSALELLVHRLIDSSIPSIRHVAASGLYINLIEQDGYEEAADVLASTEWTEDGAKSAEVDQLCSLMRLSAPARAETPEENSAPVVLSKKQLVVPEYSELVKEAHW
jgi:hypothetical protein